MEHKRTADDAGVGDGFGQTKVPRMTDVLAALDMRVTNKLDDLVASGVMAQGELDSKALGELAEFEPQDAIEILDQFQDSGLEGVRNKSAYLHGVMIRYRKDAGPRLDRDVHARLDKLYRSSKVKASDFDQRVYENLASLPPPSAIRAIDRFQAKITDDVRNISAFFTSILRQEMASMGPGFGPGGGEFAGPRGGYRDEPPRERPYGRQYDPFDQYDAPPERFEGYAGPPRPLAGPPPQRAPPPLQPGIQLAAGPAAATPQIVILSPEQLAQLQQPGSVSLTQLLPQLMAAMQQQQQPAPQPQPVAIQSAPPVYPQVGSKRSYAVEHGQMGIRVQEFHNLSYFSEFVHPAPALKLQQLWDGGNRLVSLLDDRTWEVLSQLGAPEALAVVEEVVDNMQRQDLRNPNAFFMSCAKRYLDKAKGASHGFGGHASAQQHGQNRGPPYRPAPSTDRPYAPRGGRDSQGPPGGSGGARDGHDRDNRQRSGHGAPSGGGSWFDSMPEALKQHAREAIARHHPIITEEMFDEGVVAYIKRLTREDAISVFEELMSADLSNVRNIPAYMMGMIRKAKADSAGGRRPR